MWEKSLPQRLILIGVVLVVAILLLYPPSQKLRPGLDIAGGTELIFEIQEVEGENYPNLAEDMKRLLQKRVDPKGVYGLEWRVMGKNRIGVQMPLPPKEAKDLRDKYDASLKGVFAGNIRRGQLEAALRAPAADRPGELAALAGGSANREQLLREAAKRYDDYVAAREAADAGPPPTQPSSAPSSLPTSTQAASAPTTERASPITQEELDLDVRDALELLEDAKDAVLETNLDPRRFQDTLELDANSETRRNSIRAWRDQFPKLAGAIGEAVKDFDAWREKRGFLDGPADLRRLIRGSGVLEFRILSEPSAENVTKYDRYREQLREYGADWRRPEDTEGWFKIDNPMAFFDLDSPTELKALDPRSLTRMVVDKYEGNWYVLAKLGQNDGLLANSTRKWQLKRAYPDRDERGRRSVSFVLDPVGGQLFERLTENNIDKPLCILVDNVAYSAPNIQTRISRFGRITGEFSAEKVNYLVQTMQAGALPARLKETPISERTVGSSLGKTNLTMAFRAGVAGVIAVALLMLGYYLVSGAIADAALLFNIILVLAAMAMLGARFTLAGIAGVILTVGMTVDANVLIFERMREEKARGSSLRMIIKNGYDKAFSTIIDANVTTLLICVIIYYVGSEEIKGFGLTLGWGIVMSLFTALFVTRTIFAVLVKYHLIKDIQMLHLIGIPKIDWYAKRKIFVPLSFIVVIAGTSLLFTRSKEDLLDIEFSGGVSAEVELKRADLTDVDLKNRLKTVGDDISAAAQHLAGTTVESAAGDPSLLTVSAPDLDADQLAALLAEPLEDANMLQHEGLDVHAGPNRISVRVPEGVTADQVREFAQGYVERASIAGGNIAAARIGAVLETGDQTEKGRIWDVTTTVTNKRLVEYALATALGDDLQRQPKVAYVFTGIGGHAYPITERELSLVVPDIPPEADRNIADYYEGAALRFDDLNPPQALGPLTQRLRNMRLQPDYQDVPYRDFDLIGITPAGKVDGETVYSSVVIVVADPNFPYSRGPEQWLSQFARQEQNLAEAALDTEQTLRKVSQFKPQIAEQSETRAVVALVLSWAMIIGYLWLRFGRPMYGIAGVAALIHDVLIALAFVGFSGWLGGMRHPIGEALLIEDFKLNMTIVAAFLTIIGYSINDTIVIFDRIRETRGRLGIVTPEIINQSINQCMSRTLLTSVTTFIVLLTMYIFGGISIRGFNYCMMIGVITGTYSSIAIASPLLQLRMRKARTATTG